MTAYRTSFSAWGTRSVSKVRSTAGFTAIEILMVLAIMSLVFGTIYKSFEQLNRSYTKENVKAGIQQGARIAVDFMVQDIRMAGLDPLGTANAGISAAIGPELPTTNWIEFTADADFDGEIKEDKDYEKVRYRLDGKQLMQRNRMVEEVLLDNVTNLTFTYLNSEDAPTTDINEIRSVIISLTMEKPAGRAGMISRTYTTKVRCRNL